jgi:hypothetical protein
MDDCLPSTFDILQPAMGPVARREENASDGFGTTAMCCNQIAIANPESLKIMYENGLVTSDNNKSYIH